MSLIDELSAPSGSRLLRVSCKQCGRTLSAVSLLALGDAVADHEALHGKHLVLDHETGELVSLT